MPDYLTAEKELLMLELDMDQGKDGAAEALKSFFEKHPDLSWRSDGKRFLKYRRPLSQ